MLLKITILGFCTYILLFFFNKIAIKFNLLDLPSNRKTHSKPTPYVGGIVLGIIYLFLSYLTFDENTKLKIILICSFIISIVGLIDDKIDINPYIKILLQSLPISILIYNGVYLNNLGTYEFFGILSLGVYGQIFTFLSSLLIVNEFNYCDGLDGLLSTLFVNIFCFFIIVCFFSSEIDLIKFLIYLVVPVLIFLFFNFSFFKLPKIFLGDSGSNLLGFITGSMMIYLFINHNIAPSILIWPVAFIIYEFLSTNFLRLIKKKNLLTPGNDHFHYQISRKFNLNTKEVNLTINLLNIIIIISGLSINFFIGSFFSLVAFFLFFIFYFLLRFRFFSQR